EAVASTTVTTVMLNTTITPSASTSAKPCSALPRRPSRLSIRILLAPRAVPEKDRVLELVRPDVRACVDLHWEVDRDRRQRVDSVGGVGREDVRRGEVLRELRPCRGVTGIAQFPIEIPAACQTAHGRGAVADISTATTRDY